MKNIDSLSAKSQKATLRLSFTDETSQDIVLEQAVEIGISKERKQSLCFNQTSNGKWVMTFTAPMFSGKKIKKIEMTKDGE